LGAAPRLSDLRDSGELEQIADVVLMLNRYTDNADASYDPHRLIIEKKKDRLNGTEISTKDLYIGSSGEIADRR
jgi:replicative DNA helicase